MDHLLVDTDSRGVAQITLNRPSAMNALTAAMMSELADQIEALDNRDDVKLIVLTGSGKAFCAGLDLKALNDVKLVSGAVNPEVNIPGRRMCQCISNANTAVIAKVNGFCFTGGLELALACDFIYCADEAKLGDTHAKWGLRPTWGMSQRLPARVGFAMAREMSYTARFLSGQQAASAGLANRSVPKTELDDVVNQLCDEILGNSNASIAAYKDLYRNIEGSSVMDGLRYEWATDYDIDDSADRLADFIKT